MAADDDDRRGLPGALTLIIGVLAVIGLFSIGGIIVSTVGFIIKAVVIIAIVALGLTVLKVIFFGRSRRAADSDL